MTEMCKLEDWLKSNQIQYERLQDGWRNQIIVSGDYKKFSIICHYGSYGFEQGLLELWDFENEPKGYLTAQQVEKIVSEELE